MRWISLVLLVAFFGMEVHSAEPIDNIPAILELSRASAGRRLSVEFQATVYHQESEGLSFVAENDRFIAIIDINTPLRSGDRVRLSGHTRAGLINNYVVAHACEVIGRSELAEPESIDFDRIQLNSHDCRWVETGATIDAIRSDRELTQFDARFGGHRFQIVQPTRSHDYKSLLPLLGAEVRCTGNVAVKYDPMTNEIGVRIACPSGKLDIIQPPAVPLRAVEKRNAHEIWNDRESSVFRTQGLVTFCGDDGFYVESDDIGVWVQNSHQLPVAPGDFVEVVGSSAGLPEKPLEAKIIRVDDFWGLPTPPVTATKDLTAEKIESTRRTVRGELLDHRHERGKGEFTLRLGEQTVLCQTTCEASEFAELQLASAKIIQATGTCTFYAAGKHKFLMNLPAIGDLRVATRKQTVGLAKTVVMTSLLIVALLACLAWGSSLWSQVRRKNRDLAFLTAQLKMTFDSIEDPILTIDHEMRLISANRCATDILPLPDSLGEPIDDLEAFFREADPEFARHWSTLNRGDEVQRELRLVISSPRQQVYSVYTSPVTGDNQVGRADRLWVFSDITERERLHSQLLQAQKQEAIGQLAGGLAHDFNNLLTAIIGNISVALMHQDREINSVQTELAAAMEASQRASRLVTSLLGFSRRNALDLKPNQINSIIERILILLRPALHNRATIQVDLDSDLPMVKVDEHQLEQVLLNVVLNALDADASGQVTIETYTSVRRADDIDKRFIVISIQDKGHGMTSEVRSRIFEPYFTTKESGGTGLGLAMAEGIVHQHGGRIECESTPGSGSKFLIYLPAAPLLMHPNQQTFVNPVEPSIKGLTVLVVDDEEIVRQSLAAVLGSKSAKVRTAEGGHEAMQLLRTSHKEVDVILLDWKMPGLSGEQTLSLIKQNYPHLPTIVCSGFAFDCERLRTEGPIRPDAVLEKPAALDQLCEKIAELTSARAPENRKSA